MLDLIKVTNSFLTIEPSLVAKAVSVADILHLVFSFLPGGSKSLTSRGQKTCSPEVRIDVLSVFVTNLTQTWYSSGILEVPWSLTFPNNTNFTSNERLFVL